MKIWKLCMLTWTGCLLQFSTDVSQEQITNPILETSSPVTFEKMNEKLFNLELKIKNVIKVNFNTTGKKPDKSEFFDLTMDERTIFYYFFLMLVLLRRTSFLDTF